MTSIILPSNATDPSQITSGIVPTTRVNPSTGLPSGGAALQNGDRWYKPVDGNIPNSRGIYIREGLLWVTAQKIFMNGGYGNSVIATTANANLVNDGLFMGYNEVSTSVDRTINFSPFTNMLISGFAIRFYSSVVGTNFDANNRFDLRANILNSTTSAGALITTVNSGAVLAQNGVINFFPMSSVVNIAANTQAVSATVRVKNVVGTPAFSASTLRPYWAYILQGVHP